ncbi:MAG: hypothetical protein ACXAE3_04030 [Candidatus Kariarchaeaceae archaeon]|jgi:hypothetical protein
MNIQTYILPEWEVMLKKQNMEKDVYSRFSTTGSSMAEYLDRYMMRTLPSNWFQGWTKFHFPLRSDALILDLHKVIGTHFEEFIEKFRSGRKDDFEIPNGQINKIKLLEQRSIKEHLEREADLNELRSEIKKGRKSHNKSDRKKIAKVKKKETVKPVIQEQPVKEEVTKGLDHDLVYKRWMEMVESKPISKSYWHIHEYISRYIMDFANKHNEDGRITKQVIDDFLADYGKGKRPKTMNHYNRVVYRF